MADRKSCGGEIPPLGLPTNREESSEDSESKRGGSNGN